MSYARSSFGPGNIGNLQSGIGLTYGPTIGSNDPRVPVSGMGALTNLNLMKTDWRMRQIAPSTSNVATRTSDVRRASTTGTSALIDQPSMDEQSYVEQYPEEQYQVEQSSIPSWIWVVGGLGIFATIGGIVWYALKK